MEHQAEHTGPTAIVEVAPIDAIIASYLNSVIQSWNKAPCEADFLANTAIVEVIGERITVHPPANTG